METNKLLHGKWLVLLLLLPFASTAQTTQRYLVLLRDKANSPYSVSQPEPYLSARAVARRAKQNIAIT
jgi:serine protease AprX